MPDIKLIVYGIIASLFVSLIGAAVYQFHYKPMAVLRKTIEHKDSIISDRDTTIKNKNEILAIYEKEISNLYGKLHMCEQNATKNKLDGIIEGLGGADETDIVIDFSNITY